jgi:hypothetical protein
MWTREERESAKVMPRRNQLTIELAVFGDAIRECLGLNGLYQSGRDAERLPPEEIRFYRVYENAPQNQPKRKFAQTQ